MRVLLCSLEDTDSEKFALMFGHNQFLENTKHTVSEKKALSGNSSGNMVVKSKWMTVTEIMSQILSP